MGLFRGLAPRWPKMAPRRPQDGPKMAQDGPRWPQEGSKMAKDGPRWPQDGPKTHQDGPRWPQEGPKIAQGSPKMAEWGGRRNVQVKLPVWCIQRGQFRPPRTSTRLPSHGTCRLCSQWYGNGGRERKRRPEGPAFRPLHRSSPPFAPVDMCSFFVCLIVVRWERTKTSRLYGPPVRWL